MTSADLNIQWEDREDECPFEVAHFSHTADRQRAQGDLCILIVKLGPMQRLTVSCIARLGIGKIHAKFNPCCTVAMSQEPVIRLNRDLLDNPAVAYIHAHNAAHGCFAARVERHGEPVQ